MENENVNENLDENSVESVNEISNEGSSENVTENAIADTNVTEKGMKKKKSKGLLVGLSVVALVVIAVAVVLFIFKPWSAGYVAIVDKQKITVQEYKVISKVNMQQFLASAGVDSNTTVDNYDWNQQKNGQAIKEQIQKETLKQLQENKIMLTMAEAAGVKLSKENLTEIDSAITQQYGSEEAAKGSIESDYGVTIDEFKEFYKGLVLQKNYVSAEQANSKIAVTDEEVKKYYDDNQDIFDEATISHIVLSTFDSNGSPVSEGKKAELKKQADNILTQIKAGKDMQTLATEANSSSSADNIEMTFINGQLSSQYAVLADLEQWTFANDAGTIGVIDASYGYDVVRIEKRGIKEFKDVKEQIKSMLKEAKFTEDFNKKLEAWKKDKKFEIVKNDSVLNKLNLELYK